LDPQTQSLGLYDIRKDRKSNGLHQLAGCECVLERPHSPSVMSRTVAGTGSWFLKCHVFSNSLDEF